MPRSLGFGNRDMNELTFDKVGDELFTFLPELRDRYSRELSWWQGPDRPGQFVVFGFVVSPTVRELLASNGQPALLERAFAFFEEMARSPDIQVVNLLQIEIFEWLVGDPVRLAAAWEYMGPNTKDVARRTAKIWHCEKNLPNEGRA